MLKTKRIPDSGPHAPEEMARIVEGQETHVSRLIRSGEIIVSKVGISEMETVISLNMATTFALRTMLKTHFPGLRVLAKPDF